MMKDDWIRAALTDDSVVVELLFRLRKSTASSEPLKRPFSAPLPPQKWGLRQTRSKPVTMMRKDSAATTTTTTNTRFSPTTPLSSWSGGATSPSDGGYDESSRFRSDPSSSARSKAFSEIKDEDGMLSKERFHPKKELASSPMTFHEQSAWSHNTKRMKLDLNLQSTGALGATFEEAAVSKQWNQIEASTSAQRPSPSFERSSSHSSKTKNKDKYEGGFVLPDLNMPLGEESGSESFYQIN